MLYPIESKNACYFSIENTTKKRKGAIIVLDYNNSIALHIQLKKILLRRK